MRRTTIFLGFVCAALLFYSIVRAATVSFVHDESLSYYWFSQQSLGHLWNPSPPSANHHFLNSVYIHFARVHIGKSELALRFHSVLAHVVYLLCSLTIVRRFRSPLLAVAVFALLNVNPFLLDFFSLARGYGMVAAFTLAAICIATRPTKENRLKGDVLAVVLSGLAVLANLSAVIFAIAFAGVLIVVNVRAAFIQGRPMKRALLHAAASVLALAAVSALFVSWALPRGLALQKAGELYDGGKIGFWQDTVGSLVESTLYGASWPTWLMTLLKRLIAVTVLAQWVWMGARAIRSKLEPSPPLFISAATLIAIAAGVILQHKVMHALFIQQRTALFLIPLFVVSAGYLADDVLPVLANRGQRIASAVCGIVLLATTILALRTFNVRSTLVWRYDADTRDAVMTLARSQKIEGRPLRLAVTWHLVPAVNFYITVKKLRWTPVTRNAFEELFDYYILLPGYDAESENQLKQKCTHLMAKFPGGVQLLRDCSTPE